MPKITFRHEDGSTVDIEVQKDTNLLEAARIANVAIDAPCSGNGSCGKCRVRIAAGNSVSEQTRHINSEDRDAG